MLILENATFFYSSLQLLHCNFHTGEGGENVFVDGFYVTEQLKRIDPDAFNFLASTKIPSYYYVILYFYLISLHACTHKLGTIEERINQQTKE